MKFWDSCKETFLAFPDNCYVFLILNITAYLISQSIFIDIKLKIIGKWRKSLFFCFSKE